MSGDEIALTGLRVRGFHGVYPDERRDGQDFLVDAVLSLDTRPAAASDDVADTVDYGELAQALAAVVAGDPVELPVNLPVNLSVNLLETLAQRLADVCLADSRVRRVRLTVHKPQASIPLSFGDVAVTIVRCRP